MHLHRFRLGGHDIAVVAVMLSRTDGGTHAGIIHRDADDCLLLDLQWHRRLSSAVWEGDAAFVIPDIDDDTAEDIAGRCRLISRYNAEHPREIPYAMAFDPAARFCAATGRLDMPEEMIGLTCSTFVLCVFASAGVPLVDLATWRHRPEDEERNRQLLELMRQTRVAPEHVALVERQLPCFRVRPEEVAAAAMSPVVPADIDTAEVGGTWILTVLNVNREHGYVPN